LSYLTLDRLRTDCDNLKTDYDTLKTDYDTLKTEHEQLWEYCNDNWGLIDRFAAKVNELEGVVSRKRKRTENVEDADDESEEALPLRKRTRLPEGLRGLIREHVKYLLELDEL
jgi:chromosome segregation ATPase